MRDNEARNDIEHLKTEITSLRKTVDRLEHLVMFTDNPIFYNDRTPGTLYYYYDNIAYPLEFTLGHIIIVILKKLNLNIDIQPYEIILKNKND